MAMVVTIANHGRSDDLAPLDGDRGRGRMGWSNWGRGVCAVLAASPAMAAEIESNPGASGIPDNSIATSLPGNGDPAGIRAALAARGVSYGFSYYGDVMGNPTGGFRHGAIYDGRAKVVLDLDLEKIIGWTGLSFHGNAYEIHGGGLTRDHIGNLLTATSVEALNSMRLFKASFDQKLFGGKLTVRFGQFPADAEFLVSDTAVSQFVNTTFGWPGLNQSDLPSAGPAYPLSALGVRVRFEPTENLTLMAATFDGDPAGPGLDDPQKRNNAGINFRLQDPPFTIAEAQYRYKLAAASGGLPGTVKIGGWYHAGPFDDLRFDANGLALADPRSTGIARRLRGSHAIYGLIDQQIYHLPDAAADKGINVFLRLTGAPSDRSTIDRYVDGGIKFSGFVPGRPDDSFGAGFAYARIGGGLRGASQDAVAFGKPGPVRDYEAVFEASYTAQIIPGWILQPDVQYILHPGGSLPNEQGGDASKRIPDATVIGLRTVMHY